MHKNIAIKVQNLTKVYKLYKEPIDRLKEALHPLKKSYHNDFYALNKVSFEIKRGETVGIIGRNGSGKSTLLKMITGVLSATSGRVNVHGKISAILELGAGFNPEMSGFENIYLNTSINGLTKKQTDEIIDAIIEFSELEEFIYQPVKSYSSGMKARLGFAVAININPDILIIDEALAVGDAAFRRKCFAKMEKIREMGATILFVSHSEGNIISLCNRAIWLSNGEKILEGDPKFVTDLYMKHSETRVIKKEILQKEFKILQEKVFNSKKESVPEKKEIFFQEYYEPTLQAKSTIFYEEKGAKISNVKITTLSGEQVNILYAGNKYIFSFNVDFLEYYNNIQFGMLIKTIEGSDLGGSVFPKHNQYINVNKLTNNIFQFVFEANLNSGSYLLNCSCRKIDEQIIILHKIVDAVLIKVVNHKKTVTSKIDFNIEGKIV